MAGFEKTFLMYVIENAPDMYLHILFTTFLNKTVFFDNHAIVLNEVDARDLVGLLDRNTRPQTIHHLPGFKTENMVKFLNVYGVRVYE